MIRIICVGSVKEKELTALINEYLKRITKYSKIEIIEVPDYNYDLKETLKTEGEQILKHVSSKDFVITMDIDGKELNSLELSEKIRTTYITNSNIDFIIGGSYGLDEAVKDRSNFKLSFSKLTFPHQLFRLILLEQIYRSFKIINNESYHK